MKKIIILFLIVGVFTKCSILGINSKKETVKEKIESTIKETDSTSTKTINKAIKDDFSLKVPKAYTNDSIADAKVNKRVNQILSGIDISKSSGDNSYRVWWDSKQKRIRVFVNIAQTENEKTDTSNNEKIKKTQIELIKEEWKKTVLPWWFKPLIILILMFIFRKSIFSLLSFFIPGLKTIETIKDIKINK